MSQCTCPQPAGSPHDARCPAVTGELTFAEALRLCGKTGQVEVFNEPTGDWREFHIAQPYGPHVNVNLEVMAAFSEAKFRRAKAKRSRVQEMAEEVDLGLLDRRGIYAEGGATAIRAACEWLRTLASGAPWLASASAIEREFLVPR